VKAEPPKVQTISEKHVDNDFLCVRRSAFWDSPWGRAAGVCGHVVGAVRGQVPCLARTWVGYCARGPPVPYVGGAAQARNSGL